MRRRVGRVDHAKQLGAEIVVQVGIDAFAFGRSRLSPRQRLAFTRLRRRLGAFGALSASVNLRKRIGHWELSAGAERYRATTRYALGGAELADPATVNYTRLFAGLDYHFD